METITLPINKNTTNYTFLHVYIEDAIEPTLAAVVPDTWNGWAIPYFDAHTANQIIETANGWNDHDNIGTFAWNQDENEIYQTIDNQSYKVPTININGTKYYGVGCADWMWIIS